MGKKFGKSYHASSLCASSYLLCRGLAPVGMPLLSSKMSLQEVILQGESRWLKSEISSPTAKDWDLAKIRRTTSSIALRAPRFSILRAETITRLLLKVWLTRPETRWKFKSCCSHDTVGSDYWKWANAKERIRLTLQLPPLRRMEE